MKITLKLQWNCIETALKSNKNCIEIALKLENHRSGAWDMPGDMHMTTGRINQVRGAQKATTNVHRLRPKRKSQTDDYEPVLTMNGKRRNVLRKKTPYIASLERASPSARGYWQLHWNSSENYIETALKNCIETTWKLNRNCSETTVKSPCKCINTEMKPLEIEWCAFFIITYVVIPLVSTSNVELLILHLLYNTFSMWPKRCQMDPKGRYLWRRRADVRFLKELSMSF